MVAEAELETVVSESDLARDLEADVIKVAVDDVKDAVDEALEEEEEAAEAAAAFKMVDMF